MSRTRAGWILRRALGVIALTLLAIVAGVWLYLHRAQPVTTGEISVEGARDVIRIERDANGIPTIRADNAADLMFGLGFVHAQDRLWQLETHRRIGSGRLAEAFGPAAVDNDRFLRALGARRAAEAQWQQIDGESKLALQAYARGVNEFIRSHLSARPPEFLMLGIEPGAWTPEDSLAWAIMMAWDLGGNWSNELLRMRLAQKLPVSRINELLPPYPGEKPLETSDYGELYRSLQIAPDLGQRAEAGAPVSGVEGVGSNNWALSGSHTNTGAPLLANDPHLKLSAPALWYFVRLKAPGFEVAGASMPGLPMVVLGQNRHIAWGFTNTGPDVQDLYLERIDSGDPSRYQTPDGWATFSQTKEVIKVRGAEDVPVTVRRTRHGPVISDAGGPSEGLTGPASKPTYAIAMRWTALDADVDPIAPGLALNQADSVAAFIEAARAWVAPMQNMVVADEAGHIGFIAAGRVPVRSADNDLHGLVPAPGWDRRYDWQGWLPAAELPSETDPERGWIATANQRIHAPDYPHFISSEWAMPYRQQRIEALLGAREKHSIDDLAAMQADILSLGALPLLPWVKAAATTHPLAAAAARELAAFDGTMAADKAAPLIFWAWTRQLTRLVFSDEIGAERFDSLYGSRSFRDALEGVLERHDAWWCDDKRTPAVETCESLANEALRLALDELSARFGNDVAQWQWGNAHQARSEHRPFSRVARLASLFEIRVPAPGDTYTINAGRVGLRPDSSTGELYLDEHGPSMRALYDLKDSAQSRVMHSSGQSGLPWSALYRRFVEPWRQVRYVPLWTPQGDVQTLSLIPNPSTDSR